MDNALTVSEDKSPSPNLPPALVNRVDSVTAWLFPPAQDDDNAPEFLSRKAIHVGMVSILLIFGFFGLWSALAPLNSAAISIGKVILDNNKKTIQHLEGGIVDKILVREGEHVEEGQPLIRLDETTAKARYDLLRKQFVTARAAEARLIAERDNQEAVAFPEDLTEQRKDDEAVKEALDSQERLFASRRANLEGRISILNQKIQQFKEEIKGLEAQSISSSEQIALLRREIADVERLVNNRNAPKSRLLALQRQLASINGERGEFGAMIARAEQSIGEADLEIINANNTFLNDVIEELKEAQATRNDLEERIRASEDTFNRINIVAPIEGTITDLQVHTIGGVIQPGEKLMDIVPIDDKLVIEAMIQPQDIDVVRAGLEASVRLNAYKARFVPPITGEVMHVSADRFDEQQTGQSYYKARILVDSTEIQELEGVDLYPGMPVDVLIVTGSRTMLSYLFSPIRESFSKSFREE